MPKTETELHSWVVEHNRHTTHNRGLVSAYGYNRILDVDLVAICSEMAEQFQPPIRVLDVGCGNGTALEQLSNNLQKRSIDNSMFEFWGVSLNRYEEMHIPDDRLIIDGMVAHNFRGQQFHLIISVFAIHYFWHKLEALVKIHNELLVDEGRAFLHYPGYLIRFGETSSTLEQNEADGNRLFQEYLQRHKVADPAFMLEYRTIPSYSEDDDCVLLAEFGHVRFQKQPGARLEFGKTLEAFSMFDSGFIFRHMNASPRTYVSSHYDCLHAENQVDLSTTSSHLSFDKPKQRQVDIFLDTISGYLDDRSSLRPYRIESLPFETQGKIYNVDAAIHEYFADELLLICPGAYEPLVGKVVSYARLATAIVQSQLGAVVRYNDPYDNKCEYPEYLLEKTRLMIEFAIKTASHYCATDHPKLKIMAYSSSAGAVASLASEYDCIDTLLLVSPSFDISKKDILPSLSQFKGHVRVLIGESDTVVLPKQAFWYYENATSANLREYMELPSCGHHFEGANNKELFCHSAYWAFDRKPSVAFPEPRERPSEAWL